MMLLYLNQINVSQSYNNIELSTALYGKLT